MSKKFYRVANTSNLEGLWYTPNGDFTGNIHTKYNFCKNKDLKMDFDPDLVGWISVTDSIDNLLQWFTDEDILELQKHGYSVVEYTTDNFKFYDRFQHHVIKQDTLSDPVIVPSGLQRDSPCSKCIFGEMIQTDFNPTVLTMGYECNHCGHTERFP